MTKVLESKDPKYLRSNDYRRQFLSAHYGQSTFRCRYCHKKLSVKTLTIDHLIPVDKAKKSFWVRFLLKRLHFTGVNDLRNLVPACSKCNREKSNLLGLWILRGILGKYKAYWVVVWILRIFVCCLIFWMLCCSLTKPLCPY